MFIKENANAKWLKYAVSILALCVLGFAQAESITNTWKNVAANTPQTAHEWTEIGNWNYNDRGIPNGAGAGVQFTVAHTTDVFVQLPENLALGHLRTYAGGNNLYLLGDTMSVETSARAELNGGAAVIYADMDIKATDNRLGNGGNLHVAGDLSFSGASGRPYFNSFSHRFDLFAKQVGELRSSHVTTTAAAPQSYAGGYFVYAPRGAAQQTGSWNQTEGSPYLQLAGTAHELAVGTLVTGDGIPANTFLKRIFGDSWIELSAAATKTKTANELTFAAFTPDFTQTIDSLTMLPYTARFAVLKRRAVDKAKLLCNFTFGTSNGKCIVTFGLTDDEVAAGYLPGDIDLRTVSTHANATGSRVQLANCKLLLTGSGRKLNFTGLNFICATSTSQAELCVPSTTAASLDSFTNVNGTVSKTGLGSLTMNVSSLTNEGAIVVSEGSLAIQNTSGTSGALVFAALELAAGGTLVVPATGISVGRLAAAAGAKVYGGKLTVTGTASGLPMPVDGAEVSVLVRDCSANVVPTEECWFHLDACDTNRLEFVVEEGERHVTKWYDASGSGCYAYASASHPWFIEDASNGHPMIDLGNAVFSKGTGTTGGTGAAITSRGFSLYKADGGAFSAMPVQSAFYVIDSAKGGGALLSQAGANFPQYGVPHWPEAGLGVSPILGFNGAGNGDFKNADIDNGTSTFRTNGITIYPRSTPFSGGIDVVSFTNNAAVHAKVTGTAIGKVIGGSEIYDKSANGLAFGEVILFTNGLSTTSMLDIEAYLSKKWLGRRTEGYFLSVNSLGGMADSISKVSVMGGGVIETEKLVTGGTIEGGVELLPDGCIEAVVSPEGGIMPLSVIGTLTLPDEVTVQISGSIKVLEGGDCNLVTATWISESADKTIFHVAQPYGARKRFSAKIVDSRIVLSVVPPGLSLFIR